MEVPLALVLPVISHFITYRSYAFTTVFQLTVTTFHILEATKTLLGRLQIEFDVESSSRKIQKGILFYREIIFL